MIPLHKPALIETPIRWREAIPTIAVAVCYLICFYFGLIAVRGFWEMWRAAR